MSILLRIKITIMNHIISLFTLLIITSQISICQHYYNDSFTAYKTNNYTIDGVGDEPFWTQCEWYDIQYVWIPYGTSMTTGDFSGRVKFAWTEQKLLILAEIEDDILLDINANPLDYYWEDDCLELFIDEDYSGGWHENNYGAFAYHCAINERDVVDPGDEDVNSICLNDHIVFDIDTVDNTHYIWELAVTLYDDSFDESNTSNTAVTLVENKEIGISIAYCDNDEWNRENFIGLVDVAEEHFNSSWQDADVFGKLTLMDSGINFVEGNKNKPVKDFLVYQDEHLNLVIKYQGNSIGKTAVSVFDLSGRLITESSVNLEDKIIMDIQNISSGAYIINLKSKDVNVSEMFYKY